MIKNLFEKEVLKRLMRGSYCDRMDDETAKVLIKRAVDIMTTLGINYRNYSFWMVDDGIIDGNLVKLVWRLEIEPIQ